MARCSICDHADQHGWWGPDNPGAHCPICCLSWTSTAQAHCPICCQQFTTNATADLHWVRGRHVDPHTIEGLFLGPDGVWSASPDRDPDEHRNRMARARQDRWITPATLSRSL